MSTFAKLLTQGERVVVIAEAGVNHNGDEATAHALIDAAVEADADVVKFQTFDPDKLVAPNTETTPYQRRRSSSADQRELLRHLALRNDAWMRLRDHAHDRGIGFLSTPFDSASASMLVELGVDALKLSSGELTNLPFLRDMARLGIPLLISTGMGTMDEVATAVDTCRAAPLLGIFHCVSAYPAPIDECNLFAIPSMVKAFGVPVGWSDHTVGNESAVVATAIGARFLEKHFTLDRSMPGPDHAASLEPDELSTYVSLVRSVPSMLGDGAKRRMPSEAENAPLVRRSWHAARELELGHVLDDADLLTLRPESGVSPGLDLRGRVLVKRVNAGDPISMDDLEPLE